MKALIVIIGLMLVMTVSLCVSAKTTKPEPNFDNMIEDMDIQKLSNVTCEEMIIEYNYAAHYEPRLLLSNLMILKGCKI